MLDGSSRFAFALGQSGFDQRIDQTESLTGQLVFGELMAGDIRKDFQQLPIVQIRNGSAEEDIGAPLRDGNALLAMNQLGDRFGQSSLTLPLMG